MLTNWAKSFFSLPDIKFGATCEWCQILMETIAMHMCNLSLLNIYENLYGTQWDKLYNNTMIKKDTKLKESK